MTEDHFNLILERSYSDRIQQYAHAFLKLFKAMGATDQLVINIKTNEKGQVCLFLFFQNESKTERYDWSCLLDSEVIAAAAITLTEAEALAEINALSSYHKKLFPQIITAYKEIEEVATVRIQLRNVLGYDHSIAIKSEDAPILFFVVADSFMLRQRLKNKLKE